MRGKPHARYAGFQDRSHHSATSPTTTVLLQLTVFNRRLTHHEHSLDKPQTIQNKKEIWCREGESNPHRAFAPADFKSAASANFAIPARALTPGSLSVLHSRQPAARRRSSRLSGAGTHVTDGPLLSRALAANVIDQVYDDGDVECEHHQLDVT